MPQIRAWIVIYQYGDQPGPAGCSSTTGFVGRPEEEMIKKTEICGQEVLNYLCLMPVTFIKYSILYTICREMAVSRELNQTTLAK